MSCLRMDVTVYVKSCSLCANISMSFSVAQILILYVHVVVCSGFVTSPPPLSPSVDNYMSYDDCLEDKREDYQNCSVLCNTIVLS